MTTAYKFKAYFTEDGVGTSPDPAPVCTVINMADDSKLADAQATTASTNMAGLYSYTYSGADGLDCVAYFHTTDADTDQKDIASYTPQQITDIQVDVDSILADTGTDGVVLASGAITAAVIATDAIDADAIKADAVTEIGTGVWASSARTLTQSAASVAAVLAGSNVTIQRGDTETINLTGIGVLTGYSKIWFTVKDSKYVSDTESILQIEKTDGLLHLNKLPAITATDGSITISDEAVGNISVVIKAAATAVLMPGTYYYDIQLLSSTGVVSTLTSGRIIIEADITRSIE